MLLSGLGSVRIVKNWSLSFCRGSRVEGNIFSGFVVLLLAVESISAAQSSPVCMFFPDLVKCSLLDSDVFLGPMSRV